MTRVTPIIEERLLEMLRASDPLGRDHVAASDTNIVNADGERLLKLVLATKRVSISSRTGKVPRLQRRVILSAASAGGIIAAVSLSIALTAGEAPSAFAGWKATPTAAESGQVQTAEVNCQRAPALSSLKPVLADVRGPNTLLVYDTQAGGLCIAGPSFEGGHTRGASVLPFDFAGLSISGPVAPDALQRVFTGVAIANAKLSGAEFRYNVGRVGVNVTAVTLILENGSRIKATTTNGWFGAWWPAGESTPADAAEITTASGTTTQQLVPSSGAE